MSLHQAITTMVAILAASTTAAPSAECKLDVLVYDRQTYRRTDKQTNNDIAESPLQEFRTICQLQAHFSATILFQWHLLLTIRYGLCYLWFTVVL